MLLLPGVFLPGVTPVAIIYIMYKKKVNQKTFLIFFFQTLLILQMIRNFNSFFWNFHVCHHSKVNSIIKSLNFGSHYGSSEQKQPIAGQSMIFMILDL